MEHRHLDDELQKLNANILKMAAVTEEAIFESIESLKQRDKERAQKVIDMDQIIDEMENNIEEHAIELLALFQPMATDLRFITTAGMRINTELEMIADLVVNICQRTIQLADQPILKPLVDIPKLGEQAQWMVRHAIDAFVNRDEALAKDVIFSDKKANDLRTGVIKELIHGFIEKDGSCAPRAIPLILLTRDLERICDHAASIAEDVIYMVRARIVKHHPERLQ